MGACESEQLVGDLLAAALGVVALAGLAEGDAARARGERALVDVALIAHDYARTRVSGNGVCEVAVNAPLAGLALSH